MAVNGTYQRIKAQLVAGSEVWEFQLNPSELPFDTGAQYTEVGTAATSVQNQAYFFSKGLTLSVRDAIFDTSGKGTITAALDQLQSFKNPNIKAGKLEPVTLNLVWGSRRFGPCKLTQLNWVEDGWTVNGEPDRAKVSFTLLEIPPEGIATASGRLSNEALGIAPRLTDREFQKASELGKDEITKNSSKLSAPLRDLIKSKAWGTLTDKVTGEVKLIDIKKNETRGVVGKYNTKTKTFETQGIQNLK